MCNILSLHMCDAQGPWNPDQITEYRLNFSVLFGVMRQKLYQVLVGNCSPKDFQALFDRASIRAKVKIRLGRLYSRNKVDKPKRLMFLGKFAKKALKLTPLTVHLRFDVYCIFS